MPTLDLAQVNAQFQAASPQEILRWAWQTFGEGVVTSKVSNDRLCSLGWQPQISLEQGLGEMLAYFRSLAGLSQPAQTIED